MSKGTNGAFPLLRQTRLSRFLNDGQLRELEADCKAVSRRPWATLFRQGDEAETLYFVVEGRIELRAKPPGRRLYRTIEVVGPGCTVGDEAVLGESHYQLGARTVEPTRLLQVGRDIMDRLTETHPHLVLGIARCSGSCLIRTMRRAALLTQAPAEVALRHVLDELAEEASPGDGPVRIRITQSQLAGVLHVSRETVSRLLADMVDEGLVEPGRGMIRLRR